MSQLKYLVSRNVKLYFKDKALFFTSLVTPLILLVLYSTFLGKTYKDSFTVSAPDLPDKIVNGFVSGQLMSSLLAVSSVTVTFCCNMLMVQDKANGTRADLAVSPVKGSALALGYYIATCFSSLLICWGATGLCLAYTATQGWYLSAADVALCFADVVILVLFGTALSSVVNFFLSTQGQISAVGTLVSTVYGFICGAYMPLSQFGEGLRNVLMMLPGTYGTSLIRNHSLGGALREMKRIGCDDTTLNEIRKVFDCDLFVGGNRVSVSNMYIILLGTIAALMAVYVVLNVYKEKKAFK